MTTFAVKNYFSEIQIVINPDAQMQNNKGDLKSHKMKETFEDSAF